MRRAWLVAALLCGCALPPRNPFTSYLLVSNSAPCFGEAFDVTFHRADYVPNSSVNFYLTEVQWGSFDPVGSATLLGQTSTPGADGFTLHLTSARTMGAITIQPDHFYALRYDYLVDGQVVSTGSEGISFCTAPSAAGSPPP